jgi:dolichyl-phosphate-mannose--protein O-mannosyl transferase
MTYMFSTCKSPFTASWWSNLIMAGLGLGLTISTKWVGLFTVGFVILRALSQIWALIGNRQTFIVSYSDNNMQLGMGIY